MTRRWRPSLAVVLGGGLFGTLVIALAGLVVLRYLGPEIGFKNAALILGACIAAATAFLGWLLWRLLLRPITALQTFAGAVTENPRSDIPAPAHFGTKELHATAHSVMAMAETLRDRESSIRSYSDHVTHEIKTPVAAIRAAVELLEDGGALTDEDRNLAKGIGGASAQIEAQLEALRQIARARESRYLGRSSLDSVIPVTDLAHLKLTLKDNGAQFPIAAEGLALVLGHLASNARAHGATRLSLITSAPGEPPALEITDDGPGISEGNRDRVFEPFFTTRRDSNGTGMGLAISRTIIEAHRGQIDLVEGDAGACFRITFP